MKFVAQYSFLMLGLLFLFACDSSKSKTEGNGNNSFTEVILHLSDNISPNTLEERFNKKEFKLVEKLSPSMELYLFKYNSHSVDSVGFIDELRNQQGIIKAQFNHKIKPRVKNN